MRRSLFQMGLLILGLTLMGVQAVNGVVYEAPHYRTAEMPAYQEVSWGGGQANCGVQNNCCQQNCGKTRCQYCPSPATKLTRGITNTLTGILEVPKYVIGGAFNCNVKPLDGLAVGLVRGLSRGFERTFIGVWETVTFPLAGFDPLLCPEYISLEPWMSNWRKGNYSEMPCGICCNPSQGAGCFMGVRSQAPAPQQMQQPVPMQQPAPMQQQPVPMEKPAPAFEQQLQSQAPAPPTRAAVPGSGTSRGPVTYPDDYLK